MSSVRDHTLQKQETPGHIDETNHDEIRKLLLLAWSSYLNPNPRVIDDNARKNWLDLENCPFASNLALTDTLSTGFNGCCERMKLLKFFSSDEIAANDPSVDSQAFIAESEDRGSLFISFRGTTSTVDWISNFTTMMTRWEPSEDAQRGGAGIFACLDCLCPKGKPMVHLGWYKAFLAVKELLDEFRELAKTPRHEICFVGHSQGGVLAAMAMTYFLEEETINIPTWIRNNTSVKLFSIGQPKAGDDHFQRYFYDTSNKMRKAGLLRIYRIINNQDPCVCFPPSSAGYEHVGVPICYELEGTIKGQQGVRMTFGDVGVSHSKDERTAFEEAGVVDYDIYEREMYNTDHEFKGTLMIRNIDMGSLQKIKEAHDPITYYRAFDACKDDGGIQASDIRIRERPKVKKNPSLLKFNVSSKGDDNQV
ncbi:hypothetical protein TrLO_g13295 [Triparma laevis f. longispina]|uniref:Fungal lipase-type domain-containing protein n=1 Tax=Triparma laevis f. longispina TaxID=1714387 RepID=A0A9W7KUL6_9STRA|nr:hypothetical protein TrLO_g13295 [Triparma laevis f. longispina]